MPQLSDDRPGEQHRKRCEDHATDDRSVAGDESDVYGYEKGEGER
jgi:hypothetical protein